MKDLKHLMRDHYLRYASYVILDRAIPHIADGLKPVQRRILHTLFEMHDSKFHKVANVVGQTMAYHPHGDAPIYEALVNIANRGYLLDCQGNFGNILTEDPAAAARYIETRLSPLALDILFNPQLTSYVASYDGRRQEPVTFPAKIPLLLLQGAEGIAVGMSTKILPHNFVELIEAEIAILEGRPYQILPDFPTGGFMDASDYNEGLGKVRLRAKVEIRDPKTLVIREICYGTTTESLIRSIDEAAKRGRLKIESISDYTTDKVEIEIKLIRGQYAEEMIDLLYAYTECETSITPQMVLISQQDLPQEMKVSQILEAHVQLLLGYLKKELELEAERLLHLIFEKTLEQIFIENRLYKNIEETRSSEEMHEVLEKSIVPFHAQLARKPEKADFDRLLSIPIRRIARFDIQKNEQDIAATEKLLQKTYKELKNLTGYTIAHLKSLLTRYGALFPRKTQMQTIGHVDKKAIETKQIRVGIDLKGGYVGTKIEGKDTLECTNYDKLLIFYKSGSYKVISVGEKQYVGQEGDKILHIGIADKQKVFSCCYKDRNTGLCYAKRFAIKQYIMEKSYRFFEEEGLLEFFSDESEISLIIQLVPKPKQKVSALPFDFKDVMVKNVQAHGVRVATRPVMKVERAKG